jgi:hypothetical protein
VLDVHAVNRSDNELKVFADGVMRTRHDRKREFHTQLRHMVREYESQGCSVVITGDPKTSPVLPSTVSLAYGWHQLTWRTGVTFDAKFTKALGKGGLGMADSFRTLHGGEHKCTYRSPGGPWGSSLVRADLGTAVECHDERTGVLWWRLD